MKKILSVLGTISLINGGNSILMACDNNKLFNNKLSPEEIEKSKKENRKNIKGNNLEWIAPQEKTFITVDNKWYIIIWRISKNGSWNINKFINWQNDNLQGINLINNHRLYRTLNSLEIKKEPNYIVSNWNNDDSTYFKSFYRWDGKNEPSILNVDYKTGKIKY